MSRPPFDRCSRYRRSGQVSGIHSTGFHRWRIVRQRASVVGWRWPSRQSQRAASGRTPDQSPQTRPSCADGRRCCCPCCWWCFCCRGGFVSRKTTRCANTKSAPWRFLNSGRCSCQEIHRLDVNLEDLADLGSGYGMILFPHPVTTNTSKFFFCCCWCCLSLSLSLRLSCHHAHPSVSKGQIPSSQTSQSTVGCTRRCSSSIGRKRIECRSRW